MPHYGDEGTHHAGVCGRTTATGRKVLLMIVLLTINSATGVVGGIGLAFAFALDTADKEILGVVFGFIAVIALLVSVFFAYIPRLKEKIVAEKEEEQYTQEI